MNWDRTSLRSLILSIVKPLKSGKTVSQVDTNATLDNLFPEGSDNDFRHTSPFGFISRVPVGITAFYNALFGSGYENIILGHLHKSRPSPVGVGETVLYSTDTSGNTIKVKITLKNDGTLEINTPQEINIISTGNVTLTGQASVNINSTADVTLNSQANVNVIAATKVSVACDNIELGSGAIEKVLNGETFQTYFNLHNHLDGFGIPTGAPLTPSGPSHLSSVVKAKK